MSKISDWRPFIPPPAAFRAAGAEVVTEVVAAPNARAAANAGHLGNKSAGNDDEEMEQRNQRRKDKRIHRQSHPNRISRKPQPHR